MHDGTPTCTPPSEPITLNLGQGTLFVMHPHEPTPYVVTHYSDGFSSMAYREDNPTNRAQAQEQGYEPTQYGVWASLAEHEALHTLVARIVYGLEHSPVLRTNAGAPMGEGTPTPLPYWQRLHEEAVTIALQCFLNSQVPIKPLDPWLPMLITPARRLRMRLNVWPLPSLGE